MKRTNFNLCLLFALVTGIFFIASCRHENQVLTTTGATIVRGSQTLNYPEDTKLTYDKQHSNVNWETPYMGALSSLTGRFDTFGITKFHFDETNPDNIVIQGWVWVNKVNTSEPGRDKGCLQTTFGTTTAMTTDAANVATFKATKVVYSTTDAGYIVTADLTFHGVTKSVTAKLSFAGKLVTGSTATNNLKNNYGFTIEFQFNAISDFGITSTSIGDVVKVKTDAIFHQLP
jgi:polyisoprenoid-binding protein YceI